MGAKPGDQWKEAMKNQVEGSQQNDARMIFHRKTDWPMCQIN